MSAKTIRFERMTEPNIYGYETTGIDGMTVEVVRCYDDQWNVFLTCNGHVVARSVAKYRQCKDGYLTRFEAFKVARSLAA